MMYVAASLMLLIPLSVAFWGLFLLVRWLTRVMHDRRERALRVSAYYREQENNYHPFTAHTVRTCRICGEKPEFDVFGDAQWHCLRCERLLEENRCLHCKKDLARVDSIPGMPICAACAEVLGQLRD